MTCETTYDPSILRERQDYLKKVVNNRTWRALTVFVLLNIVAILLYLITSGEGFNNNLGHVTGVFAGAGFMAISMVVINYDNVTGRLLKTHVVLNKRCFEAIKNVNRAIIFIIVLLFFSALYLSLVYNGAIPVSENLAIYTQVVVIIAVLASMTFNPAEMIA